MTASIHNLYYTSSLSAWTLPLVTPSTSARVSGYMNLGLVVLSAENEVFFQASLVTSASLATQFTLPAAGQYTIGVFRTNLVEPTVFQRKVTTAN